MEAIIAGGPLLSTDALPHIMKTIHCKRPFIMMIMPDKIIRVSTTKLKGKN